jgi:acyl-CoA thioesterase
MEEMLTEEMVVQSHALIDSLSADDVAIAVDALRSLGRSQSFSGPFTRLIGVHYDDFGDGRCTASLEVSRHLLNPLGIAHGGVTFSLADTACGAAAVSAIGGPRVVTQDMQIRYHGPGRPGAMTAAARVIHHGQRTITTECRVTQDSILLASVTATFAILSEAEVKAVRGQVS